MTEIQLTIPAECYKDCQDPNCPYIHVSKTYNWCDNCNRYHIENEIYDCAVEISACGGTVDTTDLKSVANGVWVRIPPGAPNL